MASQHFADADFSSDQAFDIRDFLERKEIWRLNVVMGLWRGNCPPFFNWWPTIFRTGLFDDAQLRGVC